MTESVKVPRPAMRKQRRQGNAVRDALVVKKRLEGKNQREIAHEVSQELGEPLVHQTVSVILNRDDIRPIMEAQYLKIIGVLPEVTDRIIAKSRALDKRLDDKINQPICWEANKLLAQTGGTMIAPNQTNIHATFINQTNNAIPPVIADLMKKYFGDIIDVKPIEIKEMEGETA